MPLCFPLQSGTSRRLNRCYEEPDGRTDVDINTCGLLSSRCFLVLQDAPSSSSNFTQSPTSFSFLSPCLVCLASHVFWWGCFTVSSLSYQHSFSETLNTRLRRGGDTFDGLAIFRTGRSTVDLPPYIWHRLGLNTRVPLVRWHGGSFLLRLRELLGLACNTHTMTFQRLRWDLGVVGKRTHGKAMVEGDEGGLDWATGPLVLRYGPRGRRCACFWLGALYKLFMLSVSWITCDSGCLLILKG